MLETIKRYIEIAEWLGFGCFMAGLGIYYHTYYGKNEIAVAFCVIALLTVCLLIKRLVHKRRDGILNISPMPLLDVFMLSMMSIYFCATDDVNIAYVIGAVTACLDLLRWWISPIKQ